MKCVGARSNGCLRCRPEANEHRIPRRVWSTSMFLCNQGSCGAVKYVSVGYDSGLFERIVSRAASCEGAFSVEEIEAECSRHLVGLMASVAAACR